MLCEADADVNVRDLIGRSPLWLAVCKDGHLNQVKILLSDKTCELNYADMREKRTALQVRSHRCKICLINDYRDILQHICVRLPKYTAQQ